MTHSGLGQHEPKINARITVTQAVLKCSWQDLS